MNIDRQKIERAKRIFQRTFTEPFYVYQQIKPQVLYKLQQKLTSLSGGKSFILNGVSLFLTYKCNLKCKMCNLWGEAGSCKIINKEEGELTIKEWKKIINDLKDYSPAIVLTGGEPFLYKDWYELTKYIKNQKLRSTMVLTNGTLLQNYAQQIIETIDSLNISIDGPKDVHDEIRGIKGIFEKIFAGIDTMENLKKEKNKKTPYINIAYTISDLNYQYLEEMIEYLQKTKLKINTLIFQHLEFIHQAGIVKTQELFKKEFNLDTYIWNGFSYQPKNLELKHLVKTINKIKRTKYENIYVVFFPDFSEEELIKYYSEPESYPQKFPERCLGPWLEALISPVGDLWLCPDYKLGNLKLNNFKELWNNEKAISFRQKLQKEGPFLPVCRCCGCFYVR